MPLHDYRCQQCLKIETRFVKIEDLGVPQIHACVKGSAWLSVMDIVYLQAPRMTVDIPAYQSPVDGKVISSRRQRKEDLRRNGCVEWDSGMNQDIEREKAAAEASQESAVESTIDEFITKLPAVKKDRLAAEMEAGVSADVTRL